MAFTAQALAQVSGAPILPNDRVIYGIATLAIPHNRGLALIGNADGSDIAGLRPHLTQSFESNRDLRRRDLLGIVFDPSGLGEDLGEFTLSDGANRPVLIEKKSS